MVPNHPMTCTTAVYGAADSIVSPARSRQVAEAAGGPVRLVAVPGADHNDPALNGAELICAIVDLATGSIAPHRRPAVHPRCRRIRVMLHSRRCALRVG
jgi:hypothetical protein